MRPDKRTLLLGRNEAPFVMQGLCSSSIKEQPVAVVLNDRPVGRFHGLEVYEESEAANAHPQTIADLVSNMYFRLSYQKPGGMSATFGTSVVGCFSFRTSDGTFHFVPDVTNAAVSLEEPHPLRICIAGVYGDLASVSSVRTYSKASVCETKMTAEVTLRALRDIHIYRSRLGYDSFRFFSVSSMFASPVCYDGSLIRCHCGQGIESVDLRTVAGRGRYLLGAVRGVSELELLKEPGSTGAMNAPGSPDSPSIRARIVKASVPVEELGIQAYLADSTDPNDDSLSLWVEWTDCPAVIPKGREMSATVEFTALPSM